MASDINNIDDSNVNDEDEEAIDNFIENLEENLEKIIVVDAIANLITNEIREEEKKESYRNDHDKKVQEMGVWIDDTFLKELLEENFDENILIINHEIEAAVEAGDNYLSTLYRTYVEYMKKGSDEIFVIKLMIKGPPSAEALVDMIVEMGVFDKEIFIYKYFLPTMREIFYKFLPKSVPFMAPFSYNCSRNNTIVMEDLREKNYVMAERKDQLDFKHSVEVLKAVARYHALSLKVFEKCPEYIEPLSRDTYLDNKTMDDLFLGGTPAFLEVIKTWDEWSKYVPVIRDLSDAWNEGLMLKLLEPAKFNVLNHGDIWVNNVLFKYNEDGSVNHASLVDYQITRRNSPVLDLLYFLFSSVKSDVLISQMNDLLRIYYNTFMETLKVVQWEVNYSFEEFRQEFEDRIAFGFFVMIIFKPLMCAEAKADIGREEEPDKNNEHVLTKCFKNPKYKESTFAIFNYLDSIGYLNNLQKYVGDFLKSKHQVGDKIEETYEIPQNSGFLSRFIYSFNKMIKEPICS